MDREEEWLALLRGQTTAQKASPLIRREVKSLNGFLEGEPLAAERVTEILGRRLSGAITEDTWPAMHDSLRQYFGSAELVYLLYWVIGVEDPTTHRMQYVEKHASAESMALFRAMVGMYSVELSRAFELYNQPLDAWSGIRRDVYFDKISGSHHLRVILEKYNGERMSIEGDPNSILTLVKSLVELLNAVGVSDEFNKDISDEFLKEVSELRGVIKPSKSKTV